MENLSQKFTTSVEYIAARGPITIHQKAFFLIAISAVIVYISRLLKSFQRNERGMILFLPGKQQIVTKGRSPLARTAIAPFDFNPFWLEKNVAPA